MASEGFHEPLDRLSPETLDHHRAISSIMEEFEAVDWYDQRVDATDDVELAEVLAHNRDEEKEHAAMTLEWLRRRDSKLDEHLRTYLFTEGSLLAIEHAAEATPGVQPMNHLFRELAPISPAAWSEIDIEAARTLQHFLSARQVVEVKGPLGYDSSAISLGRLEALADGPVDGVLASRRKVLPLVELRRPFTLDRSELDSVDRGGRDADLAPVVEACKALAFAEDTLVFNGFGAGEISGIAAASPHEPIALTEDFSRYPNHVAAAVATLKAAGMNGPYAIALGPRCYAGVIETTEKGGYPLLQHLGLILGGPVVWAPAVDGAVVVSQRGGDFELTIGQDTSIAYVSHDAATVTLELQESIAFIAASPEAAIALRYPA